MNIDRIYFGNIVNQMNRKKYKVIDLFCGCGGISEGFRQAGFHIIGGIDFYQPAIDTFQHNFRDAKSFCTDINLFSNEDIHKFYEGTDVIVGGPPCQGFSSANRWQKESEDPRNILFYQYIRFVEELQPKVFMIENVRGLLTRDNGYAKNRINEILTEHGYNIQMTVLDASEYGVPQNRKRAIIIGIRKDFQDVFFDFDSLEKKEKVTVDDAIGELYSYESSPGETKLLKERPDTPYRLYLRRKDNLIVNDEIRYPAAIVQKRIEFVPQGGNWKDVPADLWPSNRHNRHSSAYKRLKQNDQSCTIDTGNAHSNYFHPLYNRIPTVREAARLQSFPDSFEFVGTRGNTYRQVGNAVPPLLAKALADQILKILNK